MTLGDVHAVGAGAITNDASLNLAFANAAFSNAVSGSGTTRITGNDITLTGNNTGFTGTWDISGTAQAGAVTNLGTSAVFLNGTTSQLALMSSGYGFNHPLQGTGTLLATMNGVNDVFAFGPTAGNTFTGTVALGRGNFDLSGTNTTALTNATLTLANDNITTVGGDASTPLIQTIGNLSLEGAKLVFDGPTPTTPISPDKITVTNLNLMSGSIQVTIPDAQDPPEDWTGPTSTKPLLMQDDTQISPLITATAVTGHAGNLVLRNQDGSIIDTNPNTIDINEGSTKVAVGSFGYGLLSNSTGLSLTYGLTKLDLQPNQLTVLAGDNILPGADDFHAQLTGSGNLEIDATTSISIGNVTNNYTGATTVKGGTTVLNTHNALGNTSSLLVQAGATTNMNGTTQTVGQLTANGTLDLANGQLTISNGGTTAAGSL